MATTVLAGDIGGTKTILCLAQVPREQDAPVPAVLHEERFASPDFPRLAPMVRTFLRSAAEALGHAALPQRACFAVAGPVTGNAAELTNLGWSLDAGCLARELGIARIGLINDFTAVGYGLPALSPADLATLQRGSPDPQAPIALIGAGTGLGEGFLTPLPGGGFRVFPSEGSHADFAARSPLEFQLLDFLRTHLGISRVSTERVVSGPGIVAIYAFLRSREPQRESAAMAERYRLQRQAGEEAAGDLAAQISEAAQAGADSLCAQAMELFCGAYGAEAGNLCLKLLPDGGLFIAGGIAPKILPLLQAGPFMRAFGDKGRLSGRLGNIPVQVVMNARAGLMGAALYAAGLPGEPQRTGAQSP